MIETAAGDHPGVMAHIEGCSSCRLLAADHELAGRIFRQAGPPEGLERLRLGLAASVVARLPREAGSPARTWLLRPAVAGAAALLALLAVLVALQPVIPGLGGSQAPRIALGASAPALEGQIGQAEQTGLVVQRLGDSVEVLLDPNGDRIHQVAVSTTPDFSRQRVSSFRGTRWVDPAPAPIVGGVVFYRID
jgi:hypothetical protein